MQEVIDGGWYIGGPALSRFEQNFAAFCEADYAVGVGNGLDALSLALMAMDIGAGDEVIVAANGFIATFLAVTTTGARPVPVEPDPHTHNLDPARVEEAITEHTRAILPTHLYGQPADLEPLIAIAQKHRLRLLHDAAQAHGARYQGARIGAQGDAATWSFYPSKNLGALGDGGAVTCRDKTLADRIRLLGNYGSSVRYQNAEKGVNSRLDSLQAAALNAKLSSLDSWNTRRRKLAARYLDGLSTTSLGLPQVIDAADPVWHLFVVTHEARDDLAEFLGNRGIHTLIHYPIAPHRQPAYADLGFERGSFPISERLADEVLSLPIGPHLSIEQADQVISLVKEWHEAGS